MFSVKNIEPNISQDKLVVMTKCWICDKGVGNTEGNNLKDKKTSASRNLINHLRVWHSNDLTQKII
jgi:hypothetical protein